MADSKPEEGFKVVDRRLFTEEGELRKDAADQDRRWDEDSKKAASASHTPARGATPSAQPSVIAGSADIGAGIGQDNGQDNGQADAQNEGEETEAHEPSRNFQMLVDFLTRNAAAMLGGMADPRTGQAFLDLEGAREMIDMLDVLREKTKGNLAKADEDLLLEVIGSLKLTFMEISKAAAEQMQKKAGVKK